MTTEARPWGKYTILFTGTDCQVKRIEILPGRRLSLQSHQFRAEHWLITSGFGTAQVGDEMFEVKPGSTVDIPILTKHRISSSPNSTLVFIEVQTGISFDELDIERFEDDFGRA